MNKWIAGAVAILWFSAFVIFARPLARYSFRMYRSIFGEGYARGFDGLAVWGFRVVGAAGVAFGVLLIVR